MMIACSVDDEQGQESCLPLHPSFFLKATREFLTGSEMKVRAAAQRWRPRCAAPHALLLGRGADDDGGHRFKRQETLRVSTTVVSGNKRELFFFLFSRPDFDIFTRSCSVIRKHPRR
ncbi:hypothetical protein ABB37_02210 [Leptomonas pyrrhocoris]|uniref:Uncharacterized protein n=1 Tax=Leptomonas pyrrhocoris TaxID=157538 RepID=A0A0M9G7Q6_LEPPY|nr:hypothetical protein ABB37_02210 [Leptomonas pyrrhocoris]XP_015662558.1 hypothetical protein ABB37_02210 [Leptomonas pyrrhocoris]KPA84118.1 hypothetical protein ABB37_02210 [Leptomonas pyrrhocoris]KPA84119.1 hypothetical protein ABB37_02210 [Leptomonas pyrrhocoris]|eukprot:XP_015662557.1 hypothetical protein ABB37_02210 [Leptomonas pyrrhocoris]